MPLNFKTETGPRPDLAKLPVNNPEEYIGSLVYPVKNVMVKAGTMRYKTLVADSVAQTGRTPGAAPTRTLLTDSNDTFTCAEVIKRYGATKSDVEQDGGIEAVDEQGGMAAKRSVLRYIESAQAAALFDQTSYDAAPDISSAIIDGIISAAQGVKRYGGRTGFVCSVLVYQWLIQQTELTGKMGWSFSGSGLSAEQVLSMSKNVFKAMLQGLFAFDEVLIGDDDHWAIEGKLDCAAVVRLPDKSNTSEKERPVLGKTVLYLPDGEQPYELESFYDENEKVNCYDASSWMNIKELNIGAKSLVKGLGVASTSTTTTTTEA